MDDWATIQGKLELYLLEVCGEAVHILVVGKDSLGLSTEEVVVPDTQDTHDDRQVLFQRGSLEVVVHLVST